MTGDGPAGGADGASVPPDRRFYGRRRGRRMRPQRAALVEAVLPKLRLDLPAPPQHLPNPVSLFAAPVDQVWVEIGFGGGEHLAWQLAQHPTVGLVGCEPFLDGVGKLIAAVQGWGLDRLRIVPDDARPVIEALPDASIDRAFLLFPDPWPKRRHAGRRFLQPSTVTQLARILRPGAAFRLASDDPVMIDWMLQALRPHPDFRWEVAGPEDWLTRTADWPPTRYEAKQIRGTPVFLRFVRR